MSWKENVGKSAYYIKGSKIQKETINEGRETVRLNRGSDRHGKLLDPIVEYRFYDDEKWYKTENIFFTKEDILNSLE